MNKTELIDSVASATGFSKKQVKEVVDNVFSVIGNELCEGNEVVLPEVGKLKPKTRPARVGINPSTKEPMDIPASVTVAFKLSKTLKDSLNA